MEYTSVLLISDLIDVCNVSVLQQNRCTTPSTLSFTPSTATDPSCDTDEVFSRLAAVPCTPAFLEPRVSLAKSCRFPANEEPALACEEDDDGVICASYASDRTILDEVEQNCIKGANTCNNTCRAAVVSLRENLGCCVNNLFNHSLNAIYAASYELWSMCGVETVKVCGDVVDDGQAPAATKLLLAIVFLVLASMF